MGRKKKTTASATAATTATPTPPITTSTTTAKATATSQQHLPNGSITTTTTTTSTSSTDKTVDLNVLLKRAHELKEEGNRLFQLKDYTGALQRYDLALKLTPTPHPDRAVFHSNRAACLLLMPPPVDHRAVAHECSLALHCQPNYPRALLRRARALDVLGDPYSALSDAEALLHLDPSNRDGLDLARRLRSQIHNNNCTQPPYNNNPNSSSGNHTNSSSRPSPAALGASAVGATPIVGLGPCLPSRGPPSSHKKTSPPPPVGARGIPNGIDVKPKVNPSVSPSVSVSLKPVETMVASPQPPPLPRASSSAPSPPPPPPPPRPLKEEKKVERTRPLKLVYDHDIRLARMPAGCGFRGLREIVRRRFPCSRAVLVKYRDMDGDLVTITSTEELRMAEFYTDGSGEEAEKKGEKLGLLRLHVVEVNPEQEPALPEEDEEEEVKEEEEEETSDRDADFVKSEGCVPNSNAGGVGDAKSEKSESMVAEEVGKEKVDGGQKSCNHPECKEVEIDDWLFEFSQLFRTHVGIDPDAHLDVHELGNELCSEALEEMVTSEEAQPLFEMAAAKFQEVAALAYFNWGNVHMCSARKKMALDESAPKDIVAAQLRSAYDWIKQRYDLAGQKYEEALRIKPDFYEGLLALGQQHFEMAKLQWSFALANKVDLANWDSKETLGLFDSAEEKMKAATEIWEKLEEQRTNEVKDPAIVKREELLKRRRKQETGSDGQASNLMVEISPEEAAEQASAMRSQIHLFWGNMLFERSQVEFKLGIGQWKKKFDDAIERFKLAGASETDISVVIKNHSSNEASRAVDKKKVTTTTEASEIEVRDDEDKNVVESSK